MFRIISWASDNQVIDSALLTLTADRDGMSSHLISDLMVPQEVEATLWLHLMVMIKGYQKGDENLEMYQLQGMG